MVELQKLEASTRWLEEFGIQERDETIRPENGWSIGI